MHFDHKGFLGKISVGNIEDVHDPKLHLLMERIKGDQLCLSRKYKSDKQHDAGATLPFDLVKKIYSGKVITATDLLNTGLSIIKQDGRCLIFDFDPDGVCVGKRCVLAFDVEFALETLYGKPQLLAPPEEDKKS